MSKKLITALQRLNNLSQLAAFEKASRTPSKIETVEEYLARGGSITKVSPAILEPQPDVTRTSNQGGPAVFLSLEEADLFFGEPSKRKAKKVKPSLKIDLNVLPPALRAKFIAKLKEESGGEDYEEELEEIDEDGDDE